MTMHLIQHFEPAAEENALVTIVRHTCAEINSEIMAYVLHLYPRADAREIFRVEISPITRTSSFVKLYLKT